MVNRPRPNRGSEEAITLRHDRKVGRTGPTKRAMRHEIASTQIPATA